MINNRPLIIALVAGEVSGDIIGASLIRSLKSRVENINFIGISGPLMEKEGCISWFKIEELSTMGIIEVAKDIYRLLKIRNELKHRLIKLKPDIFIGIDYPDFNITLEADLKKNGIKTVHYISPSVWAWRQRRIFKIKKSVDLILVSFPFEKRIYDEFNIPCRFIGHVMADEIPLNANKQLARSVLGISHQDRCLALLPGSRTSEINMLSLCFLKTVKIILKYYPNLKIIVPLVNLEHRKKFEFIKNKSNLNFDVKFLNRMGREAMEASDVTLLSSGTATLECMLVKCPMVVAYKMNPLTFWIARKLVKTKFISLPNILSEHELVKEFLQKQCNPKLLADEILSLLDNNINRNIYSKFYSLHQQIKCNASEQAANAILELLKL